MQVLTGKSPFNHTTVHECIHAIIEGVRPERPKDAEVIGLSDALWKLIQACWSEDRTQRPSIRVIVDVVDAAAAKWNIPMSPSGPQDGEDPSPVQSDELPDKCNGMIAYCFCLFIGQ